MSIYGENSFPVDYLLDFERKKQNEISSNVWGVGNYSSVLISPTTVPWKKNKKNKIKNTKNKKNVKSFEYEEVARMLRVWVSEWNVME